MKKLLYLGIILMFASCNKNKPGKLGTDYQGGIVFYVDGNGGGLIAAPTDQSTGAVWGCQGTEIAGADGHDVGTGYQNTLDIEAGCDTAETAADICANLTLDGYEDWFLPSSSELNLMMENLYLEGLGGFASNIYWSSTEYDLNYAWIQDFNYGYLDAFAKSNAYYVRAVRAF